VTDILAAIFDIGGVLTTSPLQNIRAFESRSGIADGALRPLFSSHDGAWSRLEKGELSRRDFVAAFESEAQALGLSIDGEGFLAAFFGGLVVREDMVAAVRVLRALMKTACITNNVARDEGQASGVLALDELFDVVIESSRVGLRKPDRRIYELACESLGVAPESVVFLDDFGSNLKPAREMGMTTIKVDDASSALRELERVVGLSLT
jgi:putative hydrolase of the HAD superfamily